MSEIGQIIAIGGGGFGRNPNQPVIEKYIADQSLAEQPNIREIATTRSRVRLG